MQKHTKVYYEFFGYEECDFVPCEVCGNSAVDVHHIKPRSIATKEEKDSIQNLMGLCRYCHGAAHAGIYAYRREALLEKHKLFAKEKGLTI